MFHKYFLIPELGDEAKKITERHFWGKRGIYVGKIERVCYYHITQKMKVGYSRSRKKDGLAFRTEEAAEKYMERMKAEKAIITFKQMVDAEYLPDYSKPHEKKYCVSWSMRADKPFVEYSKTTIRNALPVFSTREIAERAARKLRKEYKAYYDA